MELLNRYKYHLIIGGLAIIGILYLSRNKLPSEYLESDNDGIGGKPAKSNKVGHIILHTGKSVTDTAQELHDSMKYSNSDTRKIMALLTPPYSTAEFKMINQRFGKRPYNKTFGSQDPYVGTVSLQPLSVWLENELNKEQWEIIKNKFNL